MDGAASGGGRLLETDILVIGGGINGAGVARDAAGRGLKVVLCEKGDLSEGTSSRSGKLVHGGLRYLEYYEFRLVREALIEREVLLEAAPHIIWPLRFVLPQGSGDRPAWLVRLGLFLYDHLGGRKRLPGTRTVDLRTGPEGRAVLPKYAKAFEYSDCWVDDARLVVLNALDARERGATVLTHTACVSARREGGGWRATLVDGASGTETEVRARLIVNTAGPWVNDVAGRVTGLNAARSVRLVKGSHIVAKKFWEGPHAWLIQNHDRRVIFINPYEGDLCLIGTTDIPFEGRAEDVAIDDGEIDYLLSALVRYFRNPPTRADIVHTFSGVRPLYDDAAENPSAVTRDYVFELDAAGGQAPILNVYGGKITTFRKLAEHAIDKVAGFFPGLPGPWTAKAPLPGGDIADADFDRWLARLKAENPFLPADLAEHYARLYGTRTAKILAGARSLDALGRHFGGLLYEAEARYLLADEWARTADDILARRTKHGLHLTAAEKAGFAAWLEHEVAAA